MVITQSGKSSCAQRGRAGRSKSGPLAYLRRASNRGREPARRPDVETANVNTAAIRAPKEPSSALARAQARASAAGSRATPGVGERQGRHQGGGRGKDHRDEHQAGAFEQGVEEPVFPPAEGGADDGDEPQEGDPRKRDEGKCLGHRIAPVKIGPPGTGLGGRGWCRRMQQRQVACEDQTERQPSDRGCLGLTDRGDDARAVPMAHLAC